MNIEEAWAAIEECAEDELEAALRAFALAVLEETLDTVARTGSLVDYYNLRKRIEALR